MAQLQRRPGTTIGRRGTGAAFVRCPVRMTRIAEVAAHIVKPGELPCIPVETKEC
ncbi:hypothetical protein Caci_6661 [Catenulispora acidiphila DSM 44928]|uniref:Uncharacterized protein n=1 Tax=Catenulispora acidiphila (strain DSM 44928 / JCM 14897 / NBRC 102108 / NRRL B-24433 / ID139908) TaxID=479433 RepID=C7Q014_CATAD|nr:hypothetical protein Caci_6661 [Catenulispora acidiphila DSM 44928]